MAFSCCLRFRRNTACALKVTTRNASLRTDADSVQEECVAAQVTTDNVATEVVEKIGVRTLVKDLCVV
jgi:hypothetical protein